MRNVLFLKLNLFIIAFLFSNAIFAATITWTGNGTGNLWSTAGNWDTGVVPSASDDVIIPANSGIVRFNHGFREVHTLNIEAGSVLRILTGRRLRITGAVSQPLINDGTLFNRGTLDCWSGGNIAFINRGSLYNRGLINFDHLPGVALYNEGTVYNRGNGTMEFGMVGGVFIRAIDGDFLNEGKIRFLTGGTGTHLFAGDGFENSSTGTIEFGDGHPGGFNVVGNAINRGTIIFVNSTSTSYPMHISGGSSFVNDPSGQIIISSSAGVVSNLAIPFDANFENNGLLHLSSTSGSNGIRVTGSATLLNNVGGKIIMDGMGTGLYVLGTSSFINYGSFTCTNSSSGIYNSGSVVNNSGGKLYFDFLYTGLAIGTSGTFTNSDGEMYFTNITDRDIYNRGLFLNTDCGYIEGDNKILNSNATMTNSGWMDYSTSGNLHESYGSLILNVGIIIDPYNRFVTALDNQEARVTALVNPQANVPYINAFDIVSNGNTNISGLYLNQGLTDFAGEYNYNSNTYTPNNAAIGATVLYAKSSINCTRTIKILVVGGIARIVQQQEDQLLLPQKMESPSSASVKLKAYPNPSTGFFRVQLPTLTANTYKLQIINAQGQIIAQQHGDSSSDNQVIFDLSEFSAGIYWTRLLNNGQFIAQEKMILIK